MGYEYKNDIEDALIDSPIDIDAEAFDELDEVYVKAKAFNEIVGLRNNHYIYSKTNSGTPITVLDAKTFGREVSHLININGYMEGK